MSEHRASVHWKFRGDDFSYAKYVRDHRWQFGGVSIDASAAPEFLGNKDYVDPEQAFVAALASCHMLTFLAIASKKRINILSYTDHAVGWLEKNELGKLSITRVELRPQIDYDAASKPDADAIGRMHHRAHEECFIANSVTTEVTVVAPAATR